MLIIQNSDESGELLAHSAAKTTQAAILIKEFTEFKSDGDMSQSVEKSRPPT